MSSRHNSGYSRKPPHTHSTSKRFSRKDRAKAQKVFNQKPIRKRKADLTRLAKIAPNLQVWLKNPTSYDIPGVDTPSGTLHNKTTKEQAQHIAKMAEKTPIHILIRDTKQPTKKQTIKKFRIIKKSTPKPQPKSATTNNAPKKTETKSEANIKMWEGYRENYESGKPKHLSRLSKEERMQKFRERLIGKRISLTLGRDFLEPVEDYLKRSGWKEWDEWAAKEVEKIDASKQKPPITVETYEVKKEKPQPKPAPEPEKPIEIDVKALTNEQGYNPIKEEPATNRRHMPTKEEILARAQELYMDDNGIFQEGLGSNLPERTELQEEGYLNRAKLDLMTPEGGKGDPAVKDYIENLSRQLEEVGFTIVPL